MVQTHEGPVIGARAQDGPPAEADVALRGVTKVFDGHTAVREHDGFRLL